MKRMAHLALLLWLASFASAQAGTLLPSHVHELGGVAIKASLLYLTAVFAFRLSKRRTLAEMSAFDFIAAVAAGAIVGRVPNSTTTSYASGAVTLVTILLVHWCITRLRYFAPIAKLFEHSPRMLLVDGKLLHHELKRSGLTPDDLHGLLRHSGITDPAQVRYVVFEKRGKVSIIRKAAILSGEEKLIREVENIGKDSKAA